MKKQALVHRSEGQVFFLVAALLAIFGGMTAIAIDLGSFMADRRDLQNAADAIALAASQDLPNSGTAQASASTWAANNSIPPSAMTVTITPQDIPSEPNPKVTIDLQREHTFTFARLIGIESATVTTSATAIRTSPSGGDGIIPLSVTADALAGATYGDEIILKYDANDLVTGNSGPIRIDGPGSGNCVSTDNYCKSLQDGSDNVICSVGSDLTYCDGPTSVDSEPGNQIAGTRTAINERIASTDSHCDEFTEVFEDDPTTSDPGAYRLVEECNPFLPGGYASERVLIVPIIDSLCAGTCTVNIISFAFFFLEGFANPASCTGIDCEIVGRFVTINQNVGLVAGTFSEDADNQFIRLVN